MGPNSVLDKGYQATTAVRQFRAVILTANDTIKEVDTANTLAVGFAQDDTAAADLGKQISSVRIIGITRAVNGVAGALARNARLAVDNQGRVVVATTGQLQVGIALTAGTAQGDHVDILLTPGVIAP